jgi:O-antigen ligase
VSDAAVERAIFGSLLTLIALAAVPIGAVEGQWDGVFEGAIFLLGACWFISMMFSKRWRVHAIVAPVVGLVLLACLQTLPVWRISVDPFETRRFAITALALGLMLAMLLYYTSSRSRLLVVVHLVVFVGAATAGLGLLLRLAPASGFAPLWSHNLHADSFGQFENRNHFALLMEMSLGPALGLAVYAGARAMSCFYAAIAVLLFAALVLSNSRGGIISMLGEFTFFTWTWFGSFQQSPSTRGVYGLHRFWRKGEALARRFVLTILFLAVALWSALWLGGEPIRRRFETIHREFTPSSSAHPSPGRVEIWTATGKLIGVHPMLGSGLGAYKTAITNYFPASYSVPPQEAHDEYLELLAGGGIVAAALGVWFVVIVISEARKRLKDSDTLQRSLHLGGLVGLVGVAIHSLVDFGLHVNVNALICCSLIAIAAAAIPSANNSGAWLVCSGRSITYE